MNTFLPIPLSPPPPISCAPSYPNVPQSSKGQLGMAIIATPPSLVRDRRFGIPDRGSGQLRRPMRRWWRMYAKPALLIRCRRARARSLVLAIARRADQMGPLYFFVYFRA